MTDLYREDLAYIHDAGFGHIARAGSAMLLKVLAARKVAGGLVVDLGTGTGIAVEQFSAAGYDVLGIDVSAEMLSIARRRAPRAIFRQQSLHDAEIPACVAVACLGECLNYVTDRGHSLRRLTALLRRIYNALEPRGVLIFDVATPGRMSGSGPQRRYFEGDDWAVLVESEANRQRRELTRRITSFRRVGDLYRRSHEEHVQRLLDSAALLAIMRKIGFRVRTSRRYGELKLAPGRIAFIATKAPR